MSEEIIPKKPIGVLQDGEGDYSSGRVIKILAAVFAIGFGIGGMFMIAKTTNPDPILADYCLKQTALFLGVATSTEIVQKLTGK